MAQDGRVVRNLCISQVMVLTQGPIYTLWQGRSPTIVISDPAIAQDLMEKRSQIYSSRPRMIVMGEVFTNNRGLLTSPYNDYWRRLRKMYPPYNV